VGGEWDGMTAAWAFAPTYVYDGYTLDLVVLYQYSRLWFPMAYNYAGYGYNVGDASGIEFRRLYDYYYYY
jgi:hypothetical protein